MRIKNIILLVVVSMLGSCAIAQIPVRMKGENKPTKNFNEKDIKLAVTSSYSEINNSIGITIKVFHNENKYNFYLFSDDVDTKGITGKLDSKNRKLWLWARNSIKNRNILANNKIDAFTFDGKFVKYDNNLLVRKDWERTGYFSFSGKSTNNFDSYLLDVNRINRDTRLTLTYVFLITEKVNRNEIIIGLTEPFIYEIPEKTLSVLFPEPEVPEVPVVVEQDPVEKWDDYVNNSLLLPFEGVRSYDELARNKDLKNVYESEQLDVKVEKTIQDISRELGGEDFRAERERLIARLEAFKKPEVTPKPVEEETVEEIKQEEAKSVKIKPEKKEPKTSKRTEVDPCIDLKKRYNSIQTTESRVSKDLIYLGNLVDYNLPAYREEMAKCSSNPCYLAIKKKLDAKNWEESLVGYERTLNKLDRDYRSVTTDKDFKSCGISTGNLFADIKGLTRLHSTVEEKLKAFIRELEYKLLDRNIFRETVQQFGGEVARLNSRFAQLQQMFILYDDRLFNIGELKKGEIKDLENANLTLDSIDVAIDSMLIKADDYYRMNSDQGNFPEESFKNETNFSLSSNDCSNLKYKYTDLIDRAKEVSPGGAGMIILIIFIVILVLFLFYYLIKSRKRRKAVKGKAAKMAPGVIPTEEEILEKNGIEIITDEDEKNKAIGLDTVRKLAGVRYFEIDVQSFIQDTCVRKVYFSRDFIIRAYRYFEDKMLSVGEGNIDDLYEYGGYIIGNWDYSPYDKEQYELSLEYFIEPGDDARFSKFNIDFGYKISFRMEEMLIDQASHGNDQVFVGWLHSHPGHNVFLSNYDIEVQERFRNQYHPNRHIALVLEPTTLNWDLGLFTFNKAGVMNNKEDVGSLLSFHDLYSWAIGENESEPQEVHMKYELSELLTVSFDRTVLFRLKMFIERELTEETEGKILFNLFGIRTNARQKGHALHIFSMEEDTIQDKAKLDFIGLFGVADDPIQLASFEDLIKEKLVAHKANVLLFYLLDRGAFVLIGVQPDGEIAEEKNWIEFTKKEILPFLIK